MPFLSLVVALDAERGIGKEGKLPWHLPSDLRHFRELTSSAPPGWKNVVLMGRKTWESLPEKARPLKGRYNLILSKTQSFKGGDYSSVTSYEEALEFAFSLPKIYFVFVIGGSSVYEVALKDSRLSTCWITSVQGTYESDTFFPALPSDFEMRESTAFKTERGPSYCFEKWQRKDASL